MDTKTIFANIQQTNTPTITSANAACANKFCVTVRGIDFDNDASVRVRENLAGSTTTVFSGNNIYRRWFSSTEDKIFFPIQNISLQNKWSNNGICLTVNNNGNLSNEFCINRPTTPIQPYFMGEVVQEYPGQDHEYTSFVVKGNATPLQGGNLLMIWGNSWKQIYKSYNVTPNTVLEFEFRANQQEAEINGIGFILAGESNLRTTTHFWQVFGTQDVGRQEYHNYSGTSFKSYSIPIGQNFTGQISQMVFLADEDTHVGQNVAFKNPRLKELDVVHPPQYFMGKEVKSVLPGQQDVDTDSYSVNNNGNGNILSLTGNTWKAIQNDYYVDNNTVLKFEFISIGEEPEINSVGFSNSLISLPPENRNWKIQGTQFVNFNLSHDYYNGNNWKEFTIPVGTTFNGSYQYLVFACDDDGVQVNKNIKFKNVRLEQIPNSPPLHNRVAKAGGSNYHWFKGASTLQGLAKYAIIKNYHKKYDETTDIIGITQNSVSIRDIVKEQLAEMRLNGQKRLRIGIWHSREQWNTENSPFYFWTKGRYDKQGNRIYLKPQYLDNIYNFMVDIKQAGFKEVMFAFFPSGMNRPTQWRNWGGSTTYLNAINATFNDNQLITVVADQNNEPIWIENWEVIKAVKSRLLASRMKHTIDLANEEVHRTPMPLRGTGSDPSKYLCPSNGSYDKDPRCQYYQSRATQLLRKIWEMYIGEYGVQDTVGFSIISRNGQDFNERKNTLANIYSNTMHPSQQSIHVYDGEASTDNGIGGLETALQWFKTHGNPSIIIGETDYNDTTTANSFINAMNNSNSGIEYILQWPVDRSQGYNIPLPMEYNEYLNNGF